MKNITFIICLLLLNSAATAQIITPSFLRYTSCPTTPSQVDSCVGWRQPTRGTSDYFNACAAGTVVGVPLNAFGYQDANDSAYVGLFAYGYNSREYIGTSCAPLIIGRTYTMTIKVSLAEVSMYGTDGLGVFFSTYQLSDPTTSTLRVTPQIDYSSYGPITDSINWVTLTKDFIADSAYTNLIVGGFKPDSNCRTIFTGTGLWAMSYYYISTIGVPDSVRTPIIKPNVYYDSARFAFPNAFTPNTDGKNDVFKLVFSGNTLIEDYTLRILNRWGELVFLTTAPAKGWDGTYKDQPCEIGAYFYLATFKANGKERILKGDVTLVR